MKQGSEGEEAGQELVAIAEVFLNNSSHHLSFPCIVDLLWINLHFNLKRIQIKSQRKKRRKFMVYDSKWEEVLSKTSSDRAMLGKEKSISLSAWVVFAIRKRRHCHSNLMCCSCCRRPRDDLPVTDTLRLFPVKSVLSRSWKSKEKTFHKNARYLRKKKE